MWWAGPPSRLTVSLGILRKITDDVDALLSTTALAGSPGLDIFGAEPIVSSMQLNMVVGVVKHKISEAISNVTVKVSTFSLPGHRTWLCFSVTA